MSVSYDEELLIEEAVKAIEKCTQKGIVLYIDSNKTGQTILFTDMYYTPQTENIRVLAQYSYEYKPDGIVKSFLGYFKDAFIKLDNK